MSGYKDKRLINSILVIMCYSYCKSGKAAAHDRMALDLYDTQGCRSYLMSNSIVVGNHASALVLLGSDIANAVEDHVKKSIVLGKAKGAVIDALHASPVVIARYLSAVDKKAEDAAAWLECRESVLHLIASSYTKREYALYCSDYKQLAESENDKRNVFLKVVGSVIGKYAVSLKGREAKDDLNARQAAENDRAAKATIEKGKLVEPEILTLSVTSKTGTDEERILKNIVSIIGICSKAESPKYDVNKVQKIVRECMPLIGYTIDPTLES